MDAADVLPAEAVPVDRARKLSAVYGLEPTWALRQGSPPTNNDVALAARLLPLLSARFSGTVDSGQSRGMFSEDFARYTAIVPALQASLGIARDGLGNGGVHTADFTVHPDALPAGIELMTRFAEFGATDDITWRQ